MVAGSIEAATSGTGISGAAGLAGPIGLGIGAAMSVAGGVGGMKAGKASAKSAAQAAAFNNQVAGQNNRLLAYQDQVRLAQLNRQGELQIAVGDQQVKSLKDQYRRDIIDNKVQQSFSKFFGEAEISTQLANRGASGVSVNEGSSLLTRLVQESFLEKQMNGFVRQRELLKDDAKSNIATTNFNTALGLQNLANEATMSRISTQIQMHNNTIGAMQNTMQGAAKAQQFKAQGTQALIGGFGQAATTIGSAPEGTFTSTKKSTN